MFEMKFEFKKILPTWSKALCLSVLEPTTWLVAQRKAQALRLGKQAFVKKKKKEKTSVVKKSVKFLRYKDEFFSRQITTTWKLYDCKL